VLIGSLDQFGLQEISSVISAASNTGCLNLSSDQAIGRIFFRNGQICYAETSPSRDDLGRKLLAIGAITHDQLLRARDGAASSGEPLWESLRGGGLVTKRQLQTAMLEETEDALTTLLGWKEGSFFFDGDAKIPAESSIETPMATLLARLSRRAEEAEQTRARLLESVPMLVRDPINDGRDVTISSNEWRVLASIDGRSTVEEIVQSIDLDKARVVDAIDHLVSAGLVEIRRSRPQIVDLRRDRLGRRRALRTPPPPPPPAPALAKGSGVTRTDSAPE
jgi:DNA-binding MarR family transcriptional regulator